MLRRHAMEGEIVRYLVSRGANLDAKDKSGRTALDVALGRTVVGGRGRGGGGGGGGAAAPEAGPMREKSAAVLKELMAAASAKLP